MVPPKEYKARPIVVQAMQLNEHNSEKVAYWCGGAVIYEWDKIVGVRIPKLDGVSIARLGDFVIKGASGEFYKKTEKAFRSDYEDYIQ